MDKDDIRLNLEACGCDKATIRKFCASDAGQQLEMLSDQRKHLLDKVHEEERRISCLDYLVYRMGKEESR